jgi:predicted transcriptional regulator
VNDWNREKSKLKAMKKAIIEQMLEEGATKEEMAEVTGYSPSAVGCIVMEIRQEQRERREAEEDKHLIRIKREMPNLPKVEYEGKTYIDVTELFMSSEWMAEE